VKNDQGIYILRFGDSNFRDMIVSFTDNLTIHDNLESIIPDAIKKGYLPNSCSAEYAELEYKGKTLNSKSQLKDHNILENEILILRDLSAAIRVSLRFRLNKKGEIVKPAPKLNKKDEIVESVEIRPNVPLREALKDAATKIREKYRYYGRKFSKYDLFLDNNKLDQVKSLKAQGITSAVELQFKPRIFFEWPPRLIWPPGPYTTYAIIGAALIVMIAGYLWYLTEFPIRPNFEVRFICKSECYVYEGNNLLGVITDKDSILERQLPEGPYKFKMFPKNLPIFNKAISYKAKRSKDLIVQEIRIDSLEGVTERRAVNIQIDGYYKDGVDRIESDKLALINRHKLDNYGEHNNNIKNISLFKGIYNINYDLPIEKLECYVINGDTALERDCYFDFNDTLFSKEINRIVFYYNK
jgi:hypothetical protein